MKKFILFFVLILIFGFFVIPGSRAGEGDNVSGFAWSENIGWISFNCNNPELAEPRCSNNYGVNIDEATGLFSGYAWSENIGWIDFAPSDPYPALPNYSACLDFSGSGQNCDDLPGTDKVGGWARALASGDGWDGWIKLRGSNPDYGVDYDKQSGELSGWAWGSDVIGWISFRGSLYGVVAIAKLPPTVQTAGETWNHCSLAGKSIPVLNWDYQDGTQAGYQIQIDDTNASFPSPEVDTGEIISASQSYATTYDFNWHTKTPDYWWRVKAKNQAGVWSGWSNVDNFDTPLHAYPTADFSWAPLKPNVGEIVQFADQSTAYGGSSLTSWLWTFQDGDPSSSFQQNPQIEFTLAGPKTVTLGVTDSNNYSCQTSKTINSLMPLPQYKEVAPTSWLIKILTNLWEFAML